jgi:hypothetical protein
MYKKLNVRVSSAFTLMGALLSSAAAQPPPRNHHMSSIWSSQNGTLYDLDVLKSRAADELVPLRSSSLAIGGPAPWSQDILTCEPQRSISLDP